jgi:hypothetical protein
MPSRIPVAFEVEYRGVAPASQFTARDTGEVVDIAPKLKLELETFNGDVEMLVLSSTQLDKVEGAPDYGKLKRGDRFTICGTVILQDRGSDRDSYLKVERVEMPQPAVKAA